MSTDADTATPAGARDRSMHAELLHRLISGAAGATTEELQLLYDAVAPVAYRGTTLSPLESRRYRRAVLDGLVDDGRVGHAESPRGRIWYPVELPDGLEVRRPVIADAGREEGDR